MTDKEVGELWQEFDSEHRTHFDYREHIRDLIRKLVEERAYLYCNDPVHEAFLESDQALSAALRDFDIDPKDWKR